MKKVSKVSKKAKLKQPIESKEEIFRKLLKSLLPQTFAQAFGFLTSVLSICVIIQFAVADGFGPTFSSIINWYEDFTHIVFGRWLDPIFSTLISFVGAIFGFSLALQSYWKHIFALCLIYVTRDAMYAYKESGLRAFFFFFSIGSLLSLVSSLISGAVPKDAQGFWPSFSIAASPTIAFLFYAVAGRIFSVVIDKDIPQHPKNFFRSARNGLQKFIAAASHALNRTIWFLFGIVIFVELNSELSSQQAGIQAFIGVMIAIASYWLAQGIIDASNAKHDKLRVFEQSACTWVGWAMFKAAIYSVWFVLGAAGFDLIRGK